MWEREGEVEGERWKRSIGERKRERERSGETGMVAKEEVREGGGHQAGRERERELVGREVDKEMCSHNSQQ